MRTPSLATRLFASVTLAALCACSAGSDLSAPALESGEVVRVAELVDNFPQADRTPFVNLESTLQSGQPWRVWGGAEVWHHGVRFTTMRDYMAEIGVDLPSMDHEVSVVVQALPTSYSFLVARHQRDDPTGGESVLVEIDAKRGQARWIMGGDNVKQPQGTVPYTAKVGDKWTLRLVGASATFFVNDRQLLSLDLAPWPNVMNPDWVRVALAGFDTDGVFTSFVARTIPG